MTPDEGESGGEASTDIDRALESRDVPTSPGWKGLALSPSPGLAEHSPF